MDHGFHIVVAFVATIAVKVKVDEVDLFSELRLTVLPHVLGSDRHLFRLFQVAQQIYNCQRAVSLKYVSHVLSKSGLGQGRGPGNRDAFFEAFLLPENRN